MAAGGESRRAFFRRFLGTPPEPRSKEGWTEDGKVAEPASAALPGFAVPDTQRDIADALVGLGRLTGVGEGRYAESRDMAGYLAAAQLGSSASIWLDRVRSGSPPRDDDPQDAEILRTLRLQIERRQKP
jgi:hypothetical protein